MNRGGTLLLSSLVMLGCGSESALTHGPRTLRFNEIVSSNQGVFIDELGEADDYVELINIGTEPVNLADFSIIDSSGEHRLGGGELLPSAVALLFADDAPEQGDRHLPFKISASGETLTLLARDGSAVDQVQVPALAEHHAFQRQPDGIGEFRDCAWATPARANGASCGPTQNPIDPDDIEFAEYEWPSPPLAPAEPLSITELSLNPAEFIEILNTSDRAVELADFSLWIAPHRVGEVWPQSEAGNPIALPDETLEPGQRIAVELREADLGELVTDPNFEGVVTLATSEGDVVTRVDFMAWPQGAVLVRYPELGNFRFCSDATPGEANESCDAVPERELADRARALLTPADFQLLAAGRHGLGTESVEFLIDMASGDAVSLLNSGSYDLHYQFVREVIEGLPRLDRCDPLQEMEFQIGWYAFSEREYFRVEGRRFLLGTLVRHAGSGLATVQFAPGDTISGTQMKHAFRTIMKYVEDPSEWSIRPQTPDQVERAREIEGQVPLVGPNAPFRGVSFQPLTPALAYGTLRFVAAEELRGTALGPRDIVVTDQVPNDIPLIGGLVTEAFQTPLAHVNILSRGRGTPNMALKGARSDPRIEPYFGRLVRLEVTGSDFSLELSDNAEALAFWDSRKPPGMPLVPRLDESVRGVQSLDSKSAADIPSIGGKAAQVAELSKVTLCGGPVSTPRAAFAIPLVHSREHFAASGATALLAQLETDPEFLADPIARDEDLSVVRALIEEHPIDVDLLDEVNAAIATRFPGESLRLRSSSNSEDLAGFNGAGLYTSVGLDPNEVPNDVGKAIRTVWASLYTTRAYDERTYYNVDPRSIAMGVLIHPAYESERVNGVAVSRDVLDPTRADRYYINAQVGEALVTNPAPGIASDQFTFAPNGWQKLVQHTKSTFSPEAPVMTLAEAEFLACNLTQIHDHFRQVLDPENQVSWFAVDIEFKLMGPEHALVIKQARPYSFGGEAPSGWCDF
jgi:hypothetical protein